MRRRADRPVLAAGAVVLGLVSTASYALQRLAAAWSATDTYARVLAQEHIPYYWRCDVALLHGVLAGSLVALALSDDAARRLLDRGGLLVLLVVLPSAVAMLLVP